MVMKTVLITGSSRGIGAAIAKKLNPEYKLVINYHNSEEAALQLLSELRKTNPLTIAVKADVSREEEVDYLFYVAEKNFGHVDILINNAGISHYSLLQDMSFDKWQEIIATNLNSVFLSSKRALPHMLARHEGVILNISSIWGETGASMETCYSASKGGVNALTKALAYELAPSGIRVNAVAPGIVDTDMMRKDFSTEELDALKEDVGVCRFAKPEEIASLVKYLISDEAGYITGDIIPIDGRFR